MHQFLCYNGAGWVIGNNSRNAVEGQTPSEDMPCNGKAMFITESECHLLSAMKNLWVLAVPIVDIIHSNCTDIYFKLRTSSMICGEVTYFIFLVACYIVLQS